MFPKKRIKTFSGRGEGCLFLAKSSLEDLAAIVSQVGNTVEFRRLQ